MEVTNGSRTDVSGELTKIKKTLKNVPLVANMTKPVLGAIRKRRDKETRKIYKDWLERHDPTSSELEKQREHVNTFSYRPLISVVVPTYNTPLEYFKTMVQSIIDQTYGEWELVIVDDASTNPEIREQIKLVADKDSRIKFKFLSKNRGIAGATNQAIKISQGEFVSLVDHDDILRPNALYEIGLALNENNSLDFIYSDEDKVDSATIGRHEPFIKPDWNPDFLRSVNYITHFTTIRRNLLDKIGYEDGGYNGAQDWELFLRSTRSIPPEKIYHIPKILYSWRVHDMSTSKDVMTKPYVVEAQKRAIENDLSARGVVNAGIIQDAQFPSQWQVLFSHADKPKVTVITDGRASAERVRKYTSYTNLDVRVDKLESLDMSSLSGDYLVVISSEKPHINDPGWIESMLGDAERAEVGFVLARHGSGADVWSDVAGIIDSNAVRLIKGMPNHSISKHLYLTARYNIKAFDKGIAMIEASKLKDAINGKTTAITSLHEVSSAVSQHGYVNLYNPYVKMVK